jgi:tight adherence protein B
VQRETGGNLAEIINNISKLVRERFKFHGRVKVLAAEGKLTAYILLGLPFGVGFLINFLNPDYMSALIDTDLGKNLITAGAVSMTFGALVIKKMIAIKV